VEKNQLKDKKTFTISRKIKDWEKDG